MPRQPHLIPWSMIGAALVAFAAMCSTGERFTELAVRWIMPTLGVMLVAGRLVKWRMGAKSPLAWIVRLVAFSVIVMIVGIPQDSIRFWYIKAEYTNLVGALLAAELVLRVWREPEKGSEGQWRGVILVLTALILTAGANTFNLRPMRIFTPIYLLLIVPSLRWFVTPAPDRSVKTPVERRRWSLVSMRVGMLATALMVGGTLTWVIHYFQRNLGNLFFNLPRTERQLHSQIGLASSPQLQSVLNPKPSMTRMLRVEGSATARHLRCSAFDTLDGSEWRPEQTNRKFQIARSWQLKTNQPGTTLRFVPLEDLDPLALPLESATIEATGLLELDPLGVLRTRKAPGPYSVVAARDRFQGPLCATPDEEATKRLLALPETLDPKVIELAKRIAGTGDPMSRATRVLQHLHAGHSYSLQYEVPKNSDPLSDFILNKRAAHCQYFASALVMLARGAGVPARLVTGFYAHEAHGNELIVRERDAHAWAEVWIDGTGWVTADATPAGGRPDAMFPPPSAWDRVVEFVKDIPRHLGDLLGSLGKGGVLALAGMATTGLMATWAFRAYRGRKKKAPPARAYATCSEELKQIMRRFEAWLRQRGMICPAHLTWREHLHIPQGKIIGWTPMPQGKMTAPHASEPPIDPAACVGFIDAYNEARFGGANGLVDLIQRLERLERS